MSQRDLLEKQEEWADTIEVKPKIKTKIKMRVTPEQSEKVQEICFENQIRWSGEECNVSYTDRPFLYIFDNRIGYDHLANEDNYVNFFSHLKEIDADLFIRTNGTCMEEKQEFVYPMWFKSKSTGDIIEFIGLKTGKLVVENVNYKNRSVPIEKNKIKHSWVKHTDDNWEQVEKPKDIKDNQQNHKNEHYKTQKIDTVARCKANMTLEQQKAICIFSIDKYLHREKGQNLSDIQKVRYYLDWLEEIENKLKEENENNI